MFTYSYKAAIVCTNVVQVTELTICAQTRSNFDYKTICVRTMDLLTKPADIFC